jgi:hypothetical protein
LELHFYNVQLLNFIGLYVMNTLKLKAVNVKEARFWNSTFAHIPVGGFEVSRAKMLNIKVKTTFWSFINEYLSVPNVDAILFKLFDLNQGCRVSSSIETL